MRRSPDRLSNTDFDVLVIGAGIVGSTIAWNASCRNLRVALIDASDFGAATSANSLKIIHGGLRYLQHGDFRRMRESIRARRQFLRLAPDLVRPLPCLMPSHGYGTRSRMAMRAAIALNALVSFDRNLDVRPDRHLPAGEVISRSRLADFAPGLAFHNATGGMIWHDAIAESTDQLNLSFVLSAAEHGATACNYVRATKLLADRGRVAGAEVRDELTGASSTIRARSVVCAAGFGNQFLNPSPEPQRWVRAANLVLRNAMVSRCAVAFEGREIVEDPDQVIPHARRNLFAVPWKGGTLIGTYYAADEKERISTQFTPSEIADFVQQVNEAGVLPPIGTGDICRVHTGLLPADDEPLAPSKTQTILTPQPGLVIVQGVKYTTSIELAAQVVDQLNAPIPMPSDASLPLISPTPDISAMVTRAVETQMAVKLSDVIMRRSSLADFGLPDPVTLEACATNMANALGWDPARKERELAELV